MPRVIPIIQKVLAGNGSGWDNRSPLAEIDYEDIEQRMPRPCLRPHPARRGGARVRHQPPSAPFAAPTPLAGVERGFGPNRRSTPTSGVGGGREERWACLVTNLRTTPASGVGAEQR